MIQHGGLVYYGGLIGATVAGIGYLRWKKLPVWKIADILAPSIALGSVFGRIGCLLNGCCYGRACDLPWAIHFPADHETHGARRASDGNLRRAAEFDFLSFSRVAVPPQKIRRPDFRDLSDWLRHLPLHRGIFSRRLSGGPHSRRPLLPRNSSACRFLSPASRWLVLSRAPRSSETKIEDGNAPNFHLPAPTSANLSSPARRPSANPPSRWRWRKKSAAKSSPWTRCRSIADWTSAPPSRRRPNAPACRIT